LAFLFEDFTLDPDRRELRRADALVAVEPQVFDLIHYLVRQRERVVSKDDLLDAIWNGRAVSDSTLTSRINAARRALGDSGDEQRLIRTVSRKGFRFVGKLRQNDAAVAAPAQPARELPAVDRPSIAVLPFTNLSADHALGLLADALTEDVTALLARVPGFFVIARSSAFVYRDALQELHRIGDELGVHYLVTGSVRASDHLLRVTAELAEPSGRHIWAGRFETERGETLTLQDEIARQLATQLEPALLRAEFTSIRRRRSDSLDAWSHYRQAVGSIVVHGWSEDGFERGLVQLQHAIAADPEFAIAHALLALWAAIGASMSLLPDSDAARQRATDSVERALALDPNDFDVLGYTGCALGDLGERLRGRKLLERAIEFDPSNAQARVALGVLQARDGESIGIDNMRLGIRQSPQDFRLGFFRSLLADGLIRAGRFEEALDEAQTACRRDGRFFLPRIVAAWALVKLARPAEARTMLGEARLLRPSLDREQIERFFGRRATAELDAVWG
jgi:TolB-like protein